MMIANLYQMKLYMNISKLSVLWYLRINSIIILGSCPKRLFGSRSEERNPRDSKAAFPMQKVIHLIFFIAIVTHCYLI